MHKSCVDCGRLFVADQDWKVRCISCWKKNKRSNDDYVSRMVRELNQARADVLYYKKRCEAQALDPDMLKRLIRLAHPDRHDGSEASTKATQYLLSLRK